MHAGFFKDSSSIENGLTLNITLYSVLPAAVYILIGAGGVMMLVGFFGCFGAVRESQCLLGSVGKN